MGYLSYRFLHVHENHQVERSVKPEALFTSQKGRVILR